MKKQSLLMLLALLLSTTVAHAESCTIVSGGTTYDIHNVEITSEKADGLGSWYIARKDDKPLFEEITVISIEGEKDNAFEVRGLTTSGINSRWGTATRHKNCWIGSDFRICVPSKQ